MSFTKAEVKEAKEYLTENLKQGDIIFLSLSHVSRSGMSRVIKCLQASNEAKDTGTLMIHETNKPTINTWEHVSLANLSWYISLAVESPYVDGMTGGVRVGGAGMDMGLALIDSLSYALYGKPVNQNGENNKADDQKLGLRYRWI